MSYPLATPVVVHFENGDTLPGHVARYVHDNKGARVYKVVFDDPLVFGGMGAGWFKASEVSELGERRIG